MIERSGVRRQQRRTLEQKGSVVRFIFHYPEVSGYDGDLLDTGPLGEVAVAAERAGFDALSVSEHPVPGARWLGAGGHQTLDPFVALGYAAGATQRIRLLTNLAVVPYRNPFLLAKSAATLDKLSGGRVILGLGAGYQKSEFHSLGVDFDERNALFDEALDVLPQHWSGEPFSYEGRHFSARDAIARPRPVQDPIPIWIGGNSALSRRRVAARAQGWMPMTGGGELNATARTPELGTVPQLAAKIAEIRSAAVQAGRADHIDLTYSYSDPALADPAAEADRHREAFAELNKAGVDWILVSCRSGDAAATFEFLAAFGATYLNSNTPASTAAH
ncbi:LLM class F420-dependent oxidoreductase [Nocardia alni]|uniref:LLM class F420-dependent oxidoreductase n=1 Tax=Nocardia alni TaxID=2815723 RepID=UPI001C213C60|nr:LLM class F420-dependent oxidoreductase [Nocardia alni]